MARLSDPLLAIVFSLGAVLSLGASWILVSRLERIGARLGLTDGLLGILAALAGDAPEITAAVTALAGHHARIGAGVVIGTNVLNLATLLGLSALVARRIALHREIVALEGAVAVSIACVCMAVVFGLLSAGAGTALAVGIFIGYVVLLSRQREALPELDVAIDHHQGRPRDAVVALGALAVVVGASIAMEQAAAAFGSRHGVPGIVTGGVVLAAVTSIPNAVAAIYLARRGRGAATLSTALNSNALNVIAGLLIPATVAGISAASHSARLVAGWYVGLTAFAMVGSSRVDLQACKLEYSIVSPK